MKQQFISLLTAFLFVVVSAGCVNSSRSHVNEKVLNVPPEEIVAKVQSSEVIALADVSKERRKIYLQVLNYADKVVSLSKLLRENLKNRGYDLVGMPSNAHFSVQVKLLQIGQSEEPAVMLALREGYGKPIAMLRKEVIDDPNRAQPKNSLDTSAMINNRYQLNSMVVDLEINEAVLNDRRHPWQKHHVRIASYTNETQAEFSLIQQGLEKVMVKKISGFFPAHIPESMTNLPGEVAN